MHTSSVLTIAGLIPSSAEGFDGATSSMFVVSSRDTTGWLIRDSYLRFPARDLTREVFVSEANERLEGRAQRVLRWTSERHPRERSERGLGRRPQGVSRWRSESVGEVCGRGAVSVWLGAAGRSVNLRNWLERFQIYWSILLAQLLSDRTPTALLRTGMPNGFSRDDRASCNSSYIQPHRHRTADGHEPPRPTAVLVVRFAPSCAPHPSHAVSRPPRRARGHATPRAEHGLSVCITHDARTESDTDVEGC
jgi:hypothetical protein